MTSCPNGAPPYSGDIGIVGRVPGFYSLYVGGDFAGTRLNSLIAERLDITGIADALNLLFAVFAEARLPDEGFVDFCQRLGRDKLAQALAAVKKGVA